MNTINDELCAAIEAGDVTAKDAHSKKIKFVKGPHWGPLCLAVRFGQVSVLKALLGAGVDTEEEFVDDIEDEYTSPIGRGAYNEYDDFLYYVRSRAWVESPTALDLAVRLGRSEAAAALLDAGAGVSERTVLMAKKKCPRLFQRLREESVTAISHWVFTCSEISDPGLAKEIAEWGIKYRRALVVEHCINEFAYLEAADTELTAAPIGAWDRVSAAKELMCFVPDVVPHMPAEYTKERLLGVLAAARTRAGAPPLVYKNAEYAFVDALQDLADLW